MDKIDDNIFNLSSEYEPKNFVSDEIKNSIKKVSIPSVKRIDNSTFANCKNLKEIVIPNSVEWIGDNVFKGCENLTVKIETSNKHISDIVDKLKESGISKDKILYI